MHPFATKCWVVVENLTRIRDALLAAKKSKAKPDTPWAQRLAEWLAKLRAAQRADRPNVAPLPDVVLLPGQIITVTPGWESIGRTKSKFEDLQAQLIQAELDCMREYKKTKDASKGCPKARAIEREIEALF